MFTVGDNKDTLIQNLKPLRQYLNYSATINDITGIRINETSAKAVLIHLAVSAFDETKENYIIKRDVVLSSWALLNEYCRIKETEERRKQYIFDTGYNGAQTPDKSFFEWDHESIGYKKELSRRKSNLLKHENRLYGETIDYYLAHFITGEDIQKLIDTAAAKWISPDTGEILLPSLSNYDNTPLEITVQDKQEITPTEINTSLNTIKLISAESTEEYSAHNDSGDSDGGRQIYTVEGVNKGALANNVVFNSISNSKVGDESKFVGAKSSNSLDDIWTNDIIHVQDGEAYVICLYVHNDNPIGLGAIAEETRVTFSLPTTVSSKHTVVGYLDSSNATPSRYWDTVTFKSDVLFYLEYLDGSAKYTNNYMGTIGIGNDSITAGFPIGYDRFDGKIPGGDKYAGIVSIEVVVHKSVKAKLLLYARICGAKEWNRGKVHANVGDIVEFQIEFANLLSRQVDDIMIRDSLPTNMEYIDDSTVLYNSMYPNGIALIDNTVTTSGINIGSYSSRGSAYVRYKGRITNNTIANGGNQLINWAYVTVHDPEGATVCKDSLSILINKRY